MPEAVRVDDGSAVERDGDAMDLRLLPLARLDLHRRGHIAALVKADGDAVSAPRRSSLAPAKTFRNSLEHAAGTRVLQVLESEGERVQAGQRRELVDVDLARKIICSRG